MIVRPATERPVIRSFGLLDRQIIDAGDPEAHQAVHVEFPIFIAIAAKPVAAIVVPFVGEADSDTVVPKCPELLDQPVVELAIPLASGTPRFQRDLAKTRRDCASGYPVCKPGPHVRDRACSTHLPPCVPSAQPFLR